MSDHEDWSDDGGVALPPPSDTSSDAEVSADEGLFDNNGPKKALPRPRVGNVRSAPVSKENSTLIVKSLDKSTTADHLQLHFAQVFPVKRAHVVTDHATGESKGFGFVSFADEDEAKKAMEELKGSILNGRKIKIDISQPRDQKEGPNGADKSQQNDADFQSKLIVRNLPWSISSPEALSKLFLSYGKVLHTSLPKNAQGRLRGFGIVILRGRKNAEAAKEAMNGKKVNGREVTVDWVLDQDEWQKNDKSSKKTPAKKAEESDEEDEELDLDDINSDDETSENDNDDDDSEHSDEEEDEDEDEDEDDEEEEEDDEDLSPTLFIRNLPFTCDDDALSEHFRQFGRLRYARVVVDPVTERPRGTGFVCFHDAEDAANCLKGAPKNTNTVITKESEKDRKKASFQSVLQNDMSDPTGKYTLDGRVLSLTSAVKRQEAGRLAEENLQKRNQRDKDKRRAFLLQEGQIPTNSERGKKLSPSEVQMREASLKQRKKLLETNPSLFVSLTRLSVRNIPRGLSSHELKVLARKAVVNYATGVKKGDRDALTRDELCRDDDAAREADKHRREKGKGIVKQVKIEFESKDGTKMREGEGGRSRGYGFIEYYTHRMALMALRALNGSSVAAGENLGDSNFSKEKEKGKKGATGPKDKAAVDKEDGRKRLIVEFALENAQVVQRRARREHSSREDKGSKGKHSKEDKPDADGADSTKSKKGSKGKGKGSQNKRGRDSESVDGEGSTRKSKKAREGSQSAAKEAPNGKAQEKDEKDKDKLAKRQRIIAKKRMQRKVRKGAA